MSLRGKTKVQKEKRRQSKIRTSPGDQPVDKAPSAFSSLRLATESLRFSASQDNQNGRMHRAEISPRPLETTGDHCTAKSFPPKPEIS